MGIKTKIILLLLSATIVTAQPEAQTWYFGIGAGIDFTSGKPEMISGPLKTNEGCSIFCDRFGKPMFFTDGQTIWNLRAVSEQVLVKNAGIGWTWRPTHG